MSKIIKPNDAIRELRNALGQFTTGVAIITAAGADAGPVGMTINSFSSVSLEPALISWCIDRHAVSYEAFVNTRHFSITVLADHQAELAMRFAARGADKFRNIETDGDAAPVVAGGCAWFMCELFRSIPLGDHTMIIGEIQEFAYYPAAPLVFSGGNFGPLQPDTVGTGRETARAA